MSMKTKIALAVAAVAAGGIYLSMQSKTRASRR